MHITSAKLFQIREECITHILTTNLQYRTVFYKKISCKHRLLYKRFKIIIQCPFLKESISEKSSSFFIQLDGDFPQIWPTSYHPLPPTPRPWQARCVGRCSCIQKYDNLNKWIKQLISNNKRGTRKPASIYQYGETNCVWFAWGPLVNNKMLVAACARAHSRITCTYYMSLSVCACVCMADWIYPMVCI